MRNQTQHGITLSRTDSMAAFFTVTGLTRANRAVLFCQSGLQFFYLVGKNETSYNEKRGQCNSWCSLLVDGLIIRVITVWWYLMCFQLLCAIIQT